MNQNLINRREFLSTTAAGSALFASGLFTPRLLASDTGELPKPPPVKIYKIFAGRTGDFYLTRPTQEVAKFNDYLSQLEKKLGDVQFVGGDTMPPADAAQLAEKVKSADAVLLFHMSGQGSEAAALNKILETGLPTVLFSEPYSGHDWMYLPDLRKQGRKLLILPSSDWSELDRAVALLRVPAWLRQTRIIAWGPPQGTAAACSAELIKEALGAQVVPYTDAQVKDLWKSIDPAAAKAEAQEYWMSKAKRIVEPTPEKIVDAAKLYLAIKQLMIRERAQAITSCHCMGDPRGCLTFSKLNDQGFVGACEGDMDSTLTMLLFAYAFRVPGFISDPVVDTAKNALLHFHCTSATKMDGPSGSRRPFAIRSQCDSKAGVSLEVTHRVGQPVTCAKLVNLDTLLITTGQITETTTNPMACRTQFAQSVTDAHKLFLNYGRGVIQAGVMARLHRAVFYGDHMESCKVLGDLMGFKVLDECAAA